LKVILIIVALGIALVAYAEVRKANTADSERLLTTAGFKMPSADTPEKLAHVKTMAQRKLAPPMYAVAKCITCIRMQSIVSACIRGTKMPINATRIW
jgi:hypothetical protein